MKVGAQDNNTGFQSKSQHKDQLRTLRAIIFSNRVFSCLCIIYEVEVIVYRLSFLKYSLQKFGGSVCLERFIYPPVPLN